MPDYRNLNASDLVRFWKQIVNNKTLVGRDGKFFKDALVYMTPVQILEGMYKYKGQNTITVHQFLVQKDDWLEDDTIWAEIELACSVSGNVPPSYYTYKDLEYEETPDAYHWRRESRKQLINWADEVLA